MRAEEQFSVTRGLKTLLAVAILSLTAFSLAPSAAAAPQGPWLLPAINLSAAEQDAEEARIAVAPDGTATVVWERDNGTDSIIQASVRPPGGEFGPPEDLSAPGADSFAPEIAVGPDGRVTAVWVREVGANRVVQSATSAPGGGFAPPGDVSSPTGEASPPQVAIAGDGTATVAWVRAQPPNSVVQSSTRLPGGGFGSVVDLSNPLGNASGLEVAGASDGTITAIWRRDTGPTDQLEAATRPPAGNFGAAAVVAPVAPSISDTSIAYRPDGVAVASWSRFDGSDSDILIALRPPVGSFGPPSEVTSSPDDELEASITITPDNSTTLVWEKRIGLDSLIQTRVFPANGVPEPILDLTSPGAVAAEPAVAASPDGTVTVAWDRPDPQNNLRIQTVTRAPGAGFGSVTELSDAGHGAQEPQLAAGPDGEVTSVWRRFDGSHSIIQTASTRKASDEPDPIPVCGDARLTVGKFKANRRNGKGRLTVSTGSAGTVRLRPSASVKPAVRKLKKAGKSRLVVKARGKAAKRLEKNGKVKVKLTLTYKPDGCPTVTKKRTVTLKRK